ncbi:MAG TPA: fatty acyl-AMP ligase, partial [Thermoanaerobaculia bacterium]|nr:fatty acyl-AMP ligase [Thermoanaerobaculia bacterium]
MSSETSHSASTTFVDLLRERAQEQPLRDSYRFLAGGEAEESQLTCGELDRRARAIGALLARHGARGERALLLYPPGLEFIAAFFGCLYAGTIAVPAYPPRSERRQPRLVAIARDAQPRVVLAPAALVARAAALAEQVPELAGAVWLATDDLPVGLAEEWVPPAIGPETPVFLQYTSGSTATPKGVVVRHGNLLHNEAMIQAAFGMSAESVIVGWLPLYHDMGLIGNVLQPLYAGARCILFSPLAFLQRPLRWLQAISRYRATTSGGPNFAYDLCVRKIAERDREGLDLRSWSVAFNGAEPIHAATLDRFAAAFAPCGFDRRAFFPCYGLAEATLFVTGGEPGRPPAVTAVDPAALAEGRVAAPTAGPGRRLVGCGHVWEGQDLVIADPDTGAPCPPDRVGEIWVGGPSVAAGYWQRPEPTAETFNAFTTDGRGPFLRTGDLGFLRALPADAPGELYVTGRAKDLIILRGRNLYPQDLELTAEQSHPALRPGCSAAFAVEIGAEERLVLACEVERGTELAAAGAIAEAVRRAVAEEHEAQTHEIVLLPHGSIPKTSSGKLQRQATRQLYLAGTLPALARDVVGDNLGDAGEPEETKAGAAPARGESGERTREGVEAALRARLARLLGRPAADLDRDVPLT